MDLLASPFFPRMPELRALIDQFSESAERHARRFCNNTNGLQIAQLRRRCVVCAFADDGFAAAKLRFGVPPNNGSLNHVRTALNRAAALNSPGRGEEFTGGATRQLTASVFHLASNTDISALASHASANSQAFIGPCQPHLLACTAQHLCYLGEALPACNVTARPRDGYKPVLL